MATEPSQTELLSRGGGAASQAGAAAEPSLEQQQNQRELRSLREAVAALRRLVVVALAGLTVMAWGLGIFAWRQMTFAHRQLEENRLAISEFERKVQPLYADLLNKLQAYTAANPDFKPILNRYYRPAPGQGPSSPAGTTGGAVPAQPRTPGRSGTP